MRPVIPEPVRAALALLLLAVALPAAAAGATGTRTWTAALGSPCAAPHTGPLAYHWPVKPFDQPHPVRGSFGDPRTIFAGQPSQRTLMSGTGQFSFHTGVDISAPDGTAVYPVASGPVSSTNPEWVYVDCGGGRAFKYWHVKPSVSPGQHVEADSTVLGHIITGTHHVHLTELLNGHEVNPLAAGLLAMALVGEPMTLNLIAGLVAVFAGIWIATTEGAKD